MKTLTITNFAGRLTRYNDGDINSGYAKYATSFGYDPFSKPGNLTWMEIPIQIDSSEATIDDAIMDGKTRIESGLIYMYGIGSVNKRLYKVQVNASGNANFDTPSILTTISSTVSYSPSIDFAGATERIYLGINGGVLRIDFDGTNEQMIGTAGSYTANVPRPLQQFQGKLYFGNGSNIGEIDIAANTVISYAKLSPSLPANTQVRDLDISSDGNYLIITVSRQTLDVINITGQDQRLASNLESYTFKWNGSDSGATALNIFPQSLTANITFGDKQYTFGSDTFGGSVFNPINKIITQPKAVAPYPHAMDISGNLISWMTPEYDGGVLKASQFIYGTLDEEVPTGLWRLQRMSSKSPQTDILRIPLQRFVMNNVYGESYSAYASDVVGTGKLYFSTLETTSVTQVYRFYKSFLVPTGSGTPTAGVYETQNQLFSKKVNFHGNKSSKRLP